MRAGRGEHDRSRDRPGKQPARTYDQPSGPVLLIVLAIGLVVFGVYGLCEARWRKV